MKVTADLGGPASLNKKFTCLRLVRCQAT